MGQHIKKLRFRPRGGLRLFELHPLRGASLLLAVVTCLFASTNFSAPAALAGAKTARRQAKTQDVLPSHPDGEAADTQAANSDLASRALAEAEILNSKWEEEALRQAVQKYEQAASLWLSVSRGKAADALRSAGDVYFILSDYKQALRYYGRAFTTIKGTGDRAEELRILNSIGYSHIYLGENNKALSYAKRVRDGCRQLPPSASLASRYALEAQAVNSIGEIYYAFGDLKGSLKMFRQALELWTSADDRRGLALAHLNLGYSYTDIGDLPEAREQFNQALNLWREVRDKHGEALTLTAFGSLHAFLGDNQSALNSHAEALALFLKIGNHQGEAAAINGEAQAYENLSEYQKALENYQQALKLYQFVGNRDFVALNYYYVGRVYFALKDVANARLYYSQALDLSRVVRDKQIEAHVLKGIGIIDDSEGNTADALKRFLKVLSLYNSVGDRRGKAYTLNSIGHLYYTADNRQRALDYFRSALPLIRSTEDRRGEALTLYNIARVERDYGRLEEALSHIKGSIAIIEASRVKVDSKDLRTSYFARAHKHYELYIDLLMQLYGRQHSPIYSDEAFIASERARARSLLDTLTEEKIAADAEPKDGLLTREQELAQLLSAKKEYRTRLLGDKHTAADAEQVAEDIRVLSREYEEVRAGIREQYPRYATITQPAGLSVAEVQAELGAGNTLLLEFSLGDEKSYLWAVGTDSVKGYELPGRAVIESMADRVYGLLVARQLAPGGADSPRGKSVADSDSDYVREAAELSRLLLGPAAALLGNKRLLIVADGRLHYLPFEALPVPMQSGEQSGPPRLLIDDHEIVELPSASILIAIRREAARPLASAKIVQVLADPVFDKSDPRVLQAPSPADGSPPAEKSDDIYLQRALRTLNSDDTSTTIPRLPASLKEARGIMAVTPSGEGSMVVGFEASRSRVMSDDLKNYRIIHFATHGILDSDRPEMSGLILSMIDRDGNSQDGYLRLRDVYNLNMQADLVVLSACRTGLGRDVEGEGLIGLTRGFMYAGSRGVVASLWKVDDEATAELMKNFYAFMLRDGLTPAAALRAAKQVIRSNGRWRSPYFWAGFVLQGEYTENFAPPKAKSHSYEVSLLFVIIPTAAGLFLWRAKRKRLRALSSANRFRPTAKPGAH